MYSTDSMLQRYLCTHAARLYRYHALHIAVHMLQPNYISDCVVNWYWLLNAKPSTPTREAQNMVLASSLTG
jgi:hypothetical protein